MVSVADSLTYGVCSGTYCCVPYRSPMLDDSSAAVLISFGAAAAGISTVVRRSRHVHMRCTC